MRPKSFLNQVIKLNFDCLFVGGFYNPASLLRGNGVGSGLTKDLALQAQNSCTEKSRERHSPWEACNERPLIHHTASNFSSK